MPCNLSSCRVIFARYPKPPHAFRRRNTDPEAQNNSLRSANFIEERARNYSKALHYALRYRQTTQSKYKHYYDRSQNDKLITVCAPVYCKIARIPVGHSRALTKGYYGPLGVIEVSDIAVKCLHVSSPHSKPTWIAKRRLKIITADHFPSYEEATVKYWDDIAEAQKEDFDLEPEVTCNDPQATPTATRDSDNREMQSLGDIKAENPELVHPIPQAEGAQVPEPQPISHHW